jgi:hypothetical protein
MQKRRSGCLLVTGGVVLVVAGLAAAVSSGRLPALTQSLGPLASSVAAWASSSLSPSSPSSEPSAHPSPDAGAPVHRQTAPLSSAQLGAPLIHGTFVGACGAPDDMKVAVNATVKSGRAVGVAVKTTPPNPAVASCIERAVREMQWDVSPKTDHVAVTY